VSLVVDAGWAGSGGRLTRNVYRPFLWGGLVLLLIAELVVLTLPFDPSHNLAQEGFWAGAIYTAQLGIRPTFITMVVATIFFSWPVPLQELRTVLDESPDRITSARWFTAHLGLLALLILGTRAQATRLNSIEAWEGWLLLWITVSFAALATWLFSALPPRFYVRWVARSRSAVLTALGAGLLAYGLGNWMQELWGLLQRSAFQMAATILGLFGEAVVNRPDEFVLGTSRFAVRITAHCSGLEGIGLTCAFIGIYLWTYRRQLRFPRALLLLPIGAVSMWLLNSVRIAALILVGSWNRDVALKGFHSAAGWIFFNLVAVALVWASSRYGLFAKATENEPLTPNPASPYLLPLLVLFASSLFVRILAPQLLLQAVAVPVLATLWYHRSTLLSLQWKLSWLSVLAGVGVFVLTAVVSGTSAGDLSFGTAMQHLSIPAAAGLLVLGLAGGVAVSIAQELAFRGYLERKLVASEFENVPFTKFTWLSLLGSSVAFGIIQPNWLPGIFAGMIFAAVMFRRGLLSDAIIAHVCSSGMLFALAAASSRWPLPGRF
jgi:exosortase E/protease (VPEID-CTERM system)